MILTDKQFNNGDLTVKKIENLLKKGAEFTEKQCLAIFENQSKNPDGCLNTYGLYRALSQFMSDDAIIKSMRILKHNPSEGLRHLRHPNDSEFVKTYIETKGDKRYAIRCLLSNKNWIPEDQYIIEIIEGRDWPVIIDYFLRRDIPIPVWRINQVLQIAKTDNINIVYESAITHPSFYQDEPSVISVCTNGNSAARQEVIKNKLIALNEHKMQLLCSRSGIAEAKLIVSERFGELSLFNFSFFENHKDYKVRELAEKNKRALVALLVSKESEILVSEGRTRKPTI